MKMLKFLFLCFVLLVGTVQAQNATTNKVIIVAWDYDLISLEPNMIFNVYRFDSDGKRIINTSDSNFYSSISNGIVTFISQIDLIPGTNTLVVTAFSPFTKLESFDSEKLFLPNVPKVTVIKIVKIQ